MPWACQRARAVLLGPLVQDDVDAHSFLTRDGVRGAVQMPGWLLVQLGTQLFRTMVQSQGLQAHLEFTKMKATRRCCLGHGSWQIAVAADCALAAMCPIEGRLWRCPRWAAPGTETSVCCRPGSCAGGLLGLLWRGPQTIGLLGQGYQRKLVDDSEPHGTQAASHLGHAVAGAGEEPLESGAGAGPGAGTGTGTASGPGSQSGADEARTGEESPPSSSTGSCVHAHEGRHPATGRVVPLARPSRALLVSE